MSKEGQYIREAGYNQNVMMKRHGREIEALKKNVDAAFKEIEDLKKKMKGKK